MRTFRVAGIILTAVLVAYLLSYKSSPKNSKKQEGVDTTAEQNCVDIRQRM